MNTYDVTLAQKNGSNRVDLILAPTRQQDGRPGSKSWRVLRAEPFVPGFRTTDTSPAYNPTDQMIFSQREWSGGALIERWQPQTPNGYADTSFDVRDDIEVWRGIPRNAGNGRGNTGAPFGVIIPDPYFEMPAANSTWATEGSPNSVDLDATDDPRTELFGTQHCRLDAAQSGDGISYTVNTPGPWQGKSITVAAYVKRVSGSGSIRVTITDSAGSTNGSAVNPATYDVATATRSVDGSASSLKITIEATGAGVFDIDDVTVYSGGATLEPTRIVYFEGNYYAGFGRMFCKLKLDTPDEFVWEAVRVHDTDECTDVEVHKTFMYVAWGADTAYEFTFNGTNWTTASAGSSTDNNAIKFAVSRDELWKAEENDVLRFTTDVGANGDDWSSDFVVGRDDEAINALYSFNDSIWVAKNNGLWSFVRFFADGTAADDFINQTPEFVTQPSDAVFARAQEHAGWLYLKSGEVGLFRNNGFSIEDVSWLVVRPESGVAGRVLALANSTRELFVFSGSYLLSVKQVQGEFRVHTLPGPSVSKITADVGVVEDSEGPNSTGAGGAGVVSRADGAVFSNKANIAASDNSYAVATSTGSEGFETLEITRWGFNIPEGSIIRGVEARLEGFATDSGAVDEEVYLIDGTISPATTISNNKAVPQGVGAADGLFPNNPWGGPTDLWGATLTPAIVNDNGFGLLLKFSSSGAGTFSIDHVTLTVYYTLPANPSNALGPKHAATLTWDGFPNLLCISHGIDVTDDLPYALTDVWALPISAVHDLDVEPEATASGYFKTSKWDGGLPGVVKAGDSLTLFFEGMDNEQEVTVKFGTDGAAADAVTLGTMSGPGQVQTLYFRDLADPDNDAVGKDWQFQFEGSGLKEGFRITGFEFRSHATQVRRRLWELHVVVGEAILNTGQPDPQAESTLIARLLNLENSAFPIQMTEDLDEDGEDTVTWVQIEPNGIEQVATDHFIVGPNSQVWRILLREV